MFTATRREVVTNAVTIHSLRAIDRKLEASARTFFFFCSLLHLVIPPGIPQHLHETAGLLTSMFDAVYILYPIISAPTSTPYGRSEE